MPERLHEGPVRRITSAEERERAFDAARAPPLHRVADSDPDEGRGIATKIELAAQVRDEVACRVDRPTEPVSCGNSRGGRACNTPPGITPASDPTAVEDEGIEVCEGKPPVPDCFRPVADHVGMSCVGRIGTTTFRGVDEGEGQVEVAAVREIPRTRDCLPLAEERRWGHAHAACTEGESSGASGPDHQRGCTSSTGSP